MRRRLTDRGRGVRGTGGDTPCLDVRLLLSSLLDGEGDDLQRARVYRHLRHCPECRGFESFVRGSAQVLRDRSRASEQAVAPSPLAVSALACEVRGSGVPAERRASWRSSLVSAAVAAALSLGVLIGGLGVWTLSQGEPSEVVQGEGSSALPRVVAPRTLDPDAAGEDESILTAWLPPRSHENTFDEKPMYWATPLSEFARLHYSPEQL